MKKTRRVRTWTRHIRWARNREGFRVSYSILKRDILFGRYEEERGAYSRIDYSTEVMPIPEGEKPHEDA